MRQPHSTKRSTNFLCGMGSEPFLSPWLDRKAREGSENRPAVVDIWVVSGGDRHDW